MSESAAEFWGRWTPWRHGPAGDGTFADVMRVLRLYESFATFATARIPGAGRAVTVLDLGCGAAPLAAPLRDALAARGHTMVRYIGVDFADPAWMGPRTQEVFAAAGLADRATWVCHDLAKGVPPLDLEPGDALLVTSCWGITYLEPERLGAVIRDAEELADGWRWAEIDVNLLTGGAFDRAVLTRRFLGEIVPAHLWRAATRLDGAPLREIRLAIRALPRMRQFGAEVQQIAGLMGADVFVAAAKRPIREVATALWGQTSSYAIPLRG
jgi:hypothetical protein